MCSSLSIDCREILVSVSVTQANQLAFIPLMPSDHRADNSCNIHNYYEQATVRAHRWWEELPLSCRGGCVRKPVKVAELEQYWRYGPISQGPAGTEAVVTKPLNLSCLVDLFSLPKMDLVLVYVLIKCILEIKNASVCLLPRVANNFITRLEPIFPHHRSLLQQFRKADVSGLSLVPFLLHSCQNNFYLKACSGQYLGALCCH